MISLDLKDAYLHVPIILQHRKFLRFALRDHQGILRIYQWGVLPFGLATAPRVFTKLLAPIAAHLHLRNKSMYPYMDDIFHAHISRDSVILTQDASERLYLQPGFVINLAKSSLIPSQVMTWLGAWIDTFNGLVRPSLEKVQEITQESADLLSSPWALLPDEPQDNQSVALALDNHILQELLDAFKVSDPRTRLVEQNSSFHFLQALYPKFFKAPPLEQVLATSNARGSVPATTIIDHRKVVEALYEAFMAAFRTNGHASVLVHFFDIAQDRMSRDVVLYLYRALVEQWSICLKGASSSLDLIRHQVVGTSTLGNWTPLRSRLAPIPFQGGLLFDGEILQQADCLDKEEGQLKKARSSGSRWGYLRNIFRGRSRGGVDFTVPCSPHCSDLPATPVII